MNPIKDYLLGFLPLAIYFGDPFSVPTLLLLGFERLFIFVGGEGEND